MWHATHKDVGNTNRVGNTTGAACGANRRRSLSAYGLQPKA